jgi:hypothetical protein
MTNEKQQNKMKNSKTTSQEYDYVKSNEKTLRMLKRIYGDCATDKTATFQISKKNEQQ